MRERLINRRQQGDLGEASAIEWLTSNGGIVWIPLGHSADVDLIALFGEQVIRVQVKTTTWAVRTPGGQPRWSASVATNGGNQSWNRRAKLFDPAKVDYLFVLVGDGRQWFIPASTVEARNSITLGGQKYSEFEIEPGRPLAELVYGSQHPSLESGHPQGEYPSGQRTAAVNRQAQPSQVRILSPPSDRTRRVDRPSFERKLARSGQARIWAKRRLTLPVAPFDEAGLNVGDRVRARADGPGRVVIERIEPQRRT